MFCLPRPTEYPIADPLNHCQGGRRDNFAISLLGQAEAINCTFSDDGIKKNARKALGKLLHAQ